MNSKTTSSLLYLLVVSLFFIYVSSRAFLVGVTIDEITTLQGAKELYFLDILSQSHPIANNHVLNTLLIKALLSLGVSSLAGVRLPNVLSFILYAYWAYRISARRLSSFLGIGCFILLICNPFLLDFFSLARGYGLSLGFMMGALYFGSEFISSRSTPNLISSLLLASLSVYSIFSMIYFGVGLATTLLLICFLRKDWSGCKRCLICSFSIGLALVACIAVPVLRLKNSDSLFYGGHDGFYSDTLLSLTRYSLYSLDITPSVHIILNLFLFLLLVSTIFYFKNNSWSPFKTLFLGVAVLSVALIILAHQLAGILYPINRVALFLYPLFILALCFLLSDFSPRIRNAILSLLLMAFTINFIAKGNFHRTALWSFDAHTEEILSNINERGKRIGKVVRFACTPVIYHSVNYYVEQNNYAFLEVVQDDKQIVPDGIDYYLMADRDTAAFSEESYIERCVRPLDLYDKTIVMAYPNDHLFVFESLKKR